MDGRNYIAFLFLTFVCTPFASATMPEKEATPLEAIMPPQPIAVTSSPTKSLVTIVNTNKQKAYTFKASVNNKTPIANISVQAILPPGTAATPAINPCSYNSNTQEFYIAQAGSTPTQCNIQLVFTTTASAAQSGNAALEIFYANPFPLIANFTYSVNIPNVPGPFGGYVNNFSLLTTVTKNNQKAELITAATNSAGIYFSADDGATWTAIAAAFPPYTSINAVTADAQGNLYSATSLGVYQLPLNSSTWQNIGFVDSASNIAIDSNNNIYVIQLGAQFQPSTLAQGIYDSGSQTWTWQPICSTEFGNANVNEIVLTSTNILYIATVGSPDGISYFDPTNSSTCPFIADSPASVDAMVINSNVSGEVLYTGGFIADPNNPTETFVGLIYATDADSPGSVSFVPSGIGGDNTGEITFDNINLAGNQLSFGFTSIFGAQSSTQYIADVDATTGIPDPNSLITLSGPNEEAIFTSLAVNSEKVLAGTASGVYTSPQSSSLWETSNLGIFSPISALQITPVLDSNNKNILLAGGGLSEAYYLFADSTWTNYTFQSAIECLREGCSDVHLNNFAMDSSNNIYAGTSGDAFGVWVSADNGNTWAPSGSSLPTNPNEQVTTINALAQNPADGNVVAAPLGGGVFEFESGSWTLLDSALPFTQVVTALYNDSSHLYAGTDGNGVFLYDNTNDVFNQVNITNLPDSPINALSTNANVLYAATDEGLYYSVDNADWMLATFTNTSSDLIINTMVLDPVNNVLYAGTEANEVWFALLDQNNTFSIFSPFGSIPDDNILSLAIGNGNLYVGTLSTGVQTIPLCVPGTNC